MPALLSGDIGKGLNVGNTLREVSKEEAQAQPGPGPTWLIRGTAAEQGARKRFTSGLLPDLESMVSLKLPGTLVSNIIYPGEPRGFIS